MSVYIARFTVDQLKADKIDNPDKLQLNQLKTDIEGKLFPSIKYKLRKKCIAKDKQQHDNINKQQ